MNLYEVIIDNYTLYVVANDSKQAYEHCFKCFDFRKIAVTFIKQAPNTYIFPQIIKAGLYETC